MYRLMVLRRAGGFAGLRTRNPLLHGLRATFALLATFAFFIGLQFMPLAEAFTLAFVGPIFVTALSEDVKKLTPPAKTASRHLASLSSSAWMCTARLMS